jgi:hypothetical protein
MSWDREIPRYRTVRAVHPSEHPRHATEAPWSMCSDDDCWQYAAKPIAAHETIETTAWPHASFQPLNESARRIHDFFRATSRGLPRSPWLHDRVNPELAKAMAHAYPSNHTDRPERRIP